MPDIAIFFTEIGWMGLIGRENRVERLLIGHSDAAEIWQRITAENPEEYEENDWSPKLRERLEAYAAGECEDFSDVPLAMRSLTPFQRSVVDCLRAVPYGETLSYGDLATRAGSPKAARAVGTVMAKNPVPLLVPCHRVVGSGGHLGGFSAPQGIDLKKRLLNLEATGVGRSAEYSLFS